MKRVLIFVAVLAVLLLAIKLAYRHFVTDMIMDRGMEANFPTDTLEILDGDYTYIANDILLELLAGSWISQDGGWGMTITREGTMTLTRDGETVLETPLQFTYLQPGKVDSTDILPDSVALCHQDSTPIGEISKMRHESGEGSGTICVEHKRKNGTFESLQLHKMEDTP